MYMMSTFLFFIGVKFMCDNGRLIWEITLLPSEFNYCVHFEKVKGSVKYTEVGVCFMFAGLTEMMLVRSSCR